MGIDDLAFRRIMGSFPTGVTIVTARTEAGAPVGLTANAVASVSREPPQLLVALGSRRHTAAVIRRTGRFAVNFLADRQEDLASRFARPGGDKFAGLDLRQGALGVPLLAGELARAECRVQHSLDSGDHTLFVGLIVGGGAEDGTPLMYFRRRYAAWPGAAA